MNWVDIVIIALVAFSGTLAFTRGFVREVLGIGSWAGAAFFSAWAYPYVRDRFHASISEPDIADVAGFGSLFLIGMFFLSIVSSMIGTVVRNSALGGVDRTFGIVFGLVRGAALLAAAYIVVGMVVPLDRWPQPVQEARSLPYIYEGAVLCATLLPPDYRPMIHVPPGAHETTAADLLRVIPQGRALLRP